MTANATPRFTRQANIGMCNVDAVCVSSDGTTLVGTSSSLAFSSDPTNGSFLEFARLYVTATATSTANAPATLRLFLSSTSSGNTTNANTHLISETAIPSITADVTTTATNYFILASVGVAAAASTHNSLTVFGSDY